MDTDDNTQKLADIRELLDSVDAEILQLLKHRSLLVDEVIAVKKDSKQTPHQPERFERMMQQLHELAQQEGVEQQLVDEIWNAIHHSSMRQQKIQLDKSE